MGPAEAGTPAAPHALRRTCVYLRHQSSIKVIISTFDVGQVVNFPMGAQAAGHAAAVAAAAFLAVAAAAARAPAATKFRAGVSRCSTWMMLSLRIGLRYSIGRSVNPWATVCMTLQQRRGAGSSRAGRTSPSMRGRALVPSLGPRISRSHIDPSTRKKVINNV
eukprot:SAG31_NODE_1472_length_8208_cov_5.179800_3_plen_163_part_00